MNVRHGPGGGYPPHPYTRQNQPFPGINDPFAFGNGTPLAGPPGGGRPPAIHASTGLAAANAAESLLPALVPKPAVAEVVESAPSKGGGFSLEKLTELKGVVDRLGGIDGILSNVTKVQKIVANVQQMAPLIKVLMGSFKKESKSAKKATFDEDDDLPIVRPRRRKRRKTGAGAAAKANGQRRRPRKRTR